MEMEYIFIEMEVNTKANGKTISMMDLENKNGQMELALKELTKWGRRMG
jgi:hypothetical protein